MTVDNPTNPRRFAAAPLLVASGAVAIAAISSMPAANAQTLFRNTLMRQMDGRLRHKCKKDLDPRK